MSGDRDVWGVTLWQPWAALVVLGRKRWETRPSPAPKHRTGRLADPVFVHAAVKTPPAYLTAAGLTVRQALPETGTKYALTGPLDEYPLHLGAVLGTVVIAECLPMFDADDLPNAHAAFPRRLLVSGRRGETLVDLHDLNTGTRTPLTHAEVSAGNFAPWRWGWRLTNVRSFAEPVPARGAQGWWRLPASALPHGTPVPV